MRSPSDHGDRGSATVWAATSATLLCLVFAAVLALGQVAAARPRAAAAAARAARAAADSALAGAETACGLARRVAEAQGAGLTRCHVAGEIADLTAEARAGPYAVLARARAGPSDAAVP
ncbi:Rv3654c family TadE-like protein [Streptomyces specialis]|uniref:Rv3654c family TadE-like protein n=1 Tax=Streptomyces specialis TaxID=498367 RepID=UPI001F31950C|nr:Rv3654c family TadE-like protein [Streptomyces specialis]